jgi:hypothetical protein
MKNFYKRYAPHFICALILALLLGQMNILLVRAGDPDDVIGGANPNHLVCIVDGEVIDLESDAFEEFDEDELEFDPDIEVDLKELEDECEEEGGRLEYVSQTEIEGYVYEFVRNPENPDQWMAIPAAGIPVIAEGVTFEIFWVSESNGFFYFYKTRFGAGPIVLNLRLPPDAHAINPNILIESTGFNDTWTVYLGFYRGDVGPEDIASLRTPEGASLPLGDSSFNDIVGLDGRSALPGVGGVTPEEESKPVMALAALMVILLPVAGVWTLRKNRSKKP